MRWRFLFPLRPVLGSRQRKAIGKAVLENRIKAGLSQEMLAEKSEIHPNYVGRIERGECAPTIEVLLKIAQVLKVQVRDLVAGL